MGRVSAIETSYAGCRFRSRLEARWAVAFDDLHLTWRYEAQGYRLPSGNYLPDFMVDGLDQPFFVEIKGGMPDTREFSVASEINLLVAPLVILAGDIPRRRGEGTGWIFEADSDGGEWTMVNPEQALVYGASQGQAPLTVQMAGWDTAMTKARSARFEHGEQG